MSLELAGSAFGEVPTTVGVNVPVAGVPFVSTRFTVTPLAFPTKSGFGLKWTVPSGSTLYVPSSVTTSSTSCPVVGSISLAGTFSSIGTSFSSPSIIALPPMNFGVPLCSAPWISAVVTSSPSGSAGTTTAV